ncbi:hypothetical protein [Geomicrobium sp. JCM 19038]|nr:hypothetical protein [Geomicrobium sp. JCM 19038]
MSRPNTIVEPFFGLLIAVVLLQGTIELLLVIVNVAVLLCIVLAKKYAN